MEESSETAAGAFLQLLLTICRSDLRRVDRDRQRAIAVHLGIFPAIIVSDRGLQSAFKAWGLDDQPLIDRDRYCRSITTFGMSAPWIVISAAKSGSPLGNFRDVIRNTAF